MQTLETLARASIPFFAGLADEQLAADRRLRVERRASTRAQSSSARATPADAFYLVRHGTVALETHVPGARRDHDRDARGGRGRRLVLALPAVPLALRRARARRRRARSSFDGACLRGKCEADHALGYELMTRFAQVLIERLQATRLRLLDVYGDGAAAEARRRADGAAAVPRRRGARRETRRHVDARARAGRRRAARVRAGPVHDALRLRRRRGADLDQRRPDRPGPARAHGPRRRRRHARRSARLEPGDVLGVRGPFGTAWPIAAAAGARRRRRRRRHRARAAAAGALPRARAPRALRPASRCSTARARPDDLLYRARARATGAALDVEVDVTVDAADARLARQGRRRHRSSSPARRFDPRDAVALVCGPEMMMRFAVAGAARARRAAGADPRLAGAQHAAAASATAATASSARRSSAGTARSTAGRELGAAARGAGAVSAPRKPKLAVWKFASCDGCQLTLLDCEDELLAVAGEVEIAYFLEATQRDGRGPVRPVARRGLDHHAARRRADPARSARSRGRSSRSAPAPPPAASRRCATSPTSTSSPRSSTPRPEYISTLATSTPIAAHVAGRLRAARLPDRQAPAARGAQRVPARPPARASRRTSVCIECKRRGTVCVMVAHGTPCLGPVTHAGCGALCPAYDRGCYGCFGPMETPNTGVADAAAARARA